MSLKTNVAVNEPTPAISAEDDRARPWVFSQGSLALLALVLFALVLSAPPEIGQGNERRMVAYVSDAVENNHWMCQHDEGGGIASKPPMLCWLSGASTVLTGKINRLTLYWPTALATLALSCILFRAGRSSFGARAGFLAGAMYLFSPIALGQMSTCRYDGIFTLFVTLAGLAAYRSWTVGASWTWFWLASAGATLTKGPLGLILAAAGLLAAIWERKSPDRKPIRGSHLPGIGIFLLVTGGWFALAYWQTGGAIVQKMIYEELLAHAVGKQQENLDGPGFYKPLLYFVTDFLPWSFFAIWGIWRAWKHPTFNPEQRRFERFLVCWFVFGLLLFSVGGHQRARLVAPLIPAAALLAGIQLARLTKFVPSAKLGKLAFTTALVALGGIGVYLHVFQTHGKGARQTEAMRDLVQVIRKDLGDDFPFTHADPPFAFTYYLNDLHQFASYARAASLLRDKVPAFVTVEELPRLQKQFGSNAPTFFELMRWPKKGEPMIHIVSNHPRLEWTDQMAMAVGPFRLTLNRARFLQCRGDDLTLAALAGVSSVTISNETDEAHDVRVHWKNSKDSGTPALQRSLKPGEIWELKSDG